MTYRYDIEGLRAVAVLLVVIFHINETLIPGGFIGVDLFFVISGYVITQRIYKDGLTNLGDFAEFYRRRIRRITPVMLFVTATTLIAGTTILLPDDLIDLSWSSIFSSFSAANIYFTFFLDTSYFAQDSHSVPLLHLWSLGVEEQFYLVWPILLFVLMKSPKAIYPTLIIIMVGSIACGEYWFRTGSFSAAYYMLPSRAFQLCAGGFCLFLSQSLFMKKASASALLILGILGAILVTSSAYFLTGQDAFPGLNAVPVTLGGSFLLLSGTKQNILSRALSIRPARFIGGISYSMYLWHWPILAYLRYMYVEIGAISGSFIFVAIVALSYLSTKFVEKPFRHSSANFGHIFSRMFVFPTASLCALSYITILMGGYLPIVSPKNYASTLMRLNDETKAASEYSYVCQGNELSSDDLTRKSCIINGNTEPNSLLWGDSNAAHYIGILGEIAKKNNSSFRNIEHSSCPPIYEDGHKFSVPRVRDRCKKSLEVVIPILDKYDHIIISALYSVYATSPEFLPSLKQTIDTLVKRGKHVTVVGQAIRFSNFDRQCRQKSLKVVIDCESMFRDNKNTVLLINKQIQKMISDMHNVSYVDFNTLICPEGICSPYRNGQPIYFNEGHISMYGSWLLGREAISLKEFDGVVFNSTR